MTEESKPLPRKRKATTKRERVAEPLSVALPDNVVIASSASKPEVNAPDQLPHPAEAIDIEVIKKGPPKVTAHKDRYTKIVAIENCVGRNGGIRIDIKAGETYTFPTPVANWLISIGRAK